MRSGVLGRTIIDTTKTQDALFQLSGVGVVQTDMATGRFARANAAFCAMVGYSEAELRRLTYLELTYSDDRERDTASFAALKWDESREGASLTRVVRKDGQVVWLELHVTILGKGDGTVNIAVVNDVTERVQAEAVLRESEERQAFLLALNDELRPLIAPGDIAEAAARRLAERLGVSRVAYGDIKGSKLSVEREYSRGVPSILGEYDMQAFGDDFLAAYRSGAVIVSADVAADDRFSDLVKANSAMRGLASFVDVVLFEEDHDDVSILMVHHVAPQAWSEPELNLIREVAERVRTAIERARAERALRESEARQTFLLRLSDALRPLSDALEIQRAALRVLGEQLQVDRVMYSEVDDGEATHIISDNYVRGDFPKLVGRFPTSDFGRVSERLRAGETFAVEDVTADERLSEAARAAFTELNVYAIVGVSLIKDNRWVANLGIHHAKARRWTDEEIALVQETAERIWATVEQARAEAALRESEERYRKLFNAIDEGFCTVEVAFDQDDKPIDYRFVDVNSRFEEQTGIVHGAGRWMREIAPDQDEYWFEIYGHVARSGEPARFDYFSTPLGRWWTVYAFRVEDPELRRIGVLFRDITERTRAEEALAALNRELEDKVQARTRQVQDLAGQLTLAEARERARLAQVLHDELQQQLYAVQFGLQGLRPQLQDDAVMLTKLKEIKTLVNGAVAVSRTTTANLSPPVLRNEGLVEALIWLGSDMTERYGLSVTVEAPYTFSVPSEAVRVLLFNLVRELLFNVVKHAEVSEATVTLAEDAEQLTLTVSDLGKGFDLDALEQSATGFGLSGVRKRLELFEGRLDLTSALHEGTRVSIVMPIRLLTLG